MKNANILQSIASLADMFLPAGGPEPESFKKLFTKMVKAAISQAIRYLCYRVFFRDQQQQGQRVA